jgi:hypothetical protein
MVSILRQTDKARRWTKFQFGKTGFYQQKQNAPVRKTRADALGGSYFLVIGRRSF